MKQDVSDKIHTAIHTPRLEAKDAGEQAVTRHFTAFLITQWPISRRDLICWSPSEITNPQT